VTSSLRVRPVEKDSPIHRLDARAKVLALVAIVLVTVSTPASAWPAFLGYATTLAAVATVARVPPRWLLMRMAVVIPFVLFVAVFIPFLPHAGPRYELGLWGLSVSRHGLAVLWNVTAKGLIAITAIALLSATTPFADLLAGLARLRVPRLFVTLVGMTYRYLFLLAAEAKRMKRAGDARGFGGRWLWHAGVIGRMIGMLFLRSYERGERVYLAMVSRGYDGRAVGLARVRLRSADYLFTVGLIGLAVGFRLAMT